MQLEGAPALYSLSPRERDCLRFLQAGMDTPQAAASLGISVSTLSKHLASARRKLGVARTVQALLLCSPRRDGAGGDASRRDGTDSVLIDEFQSELEACGEFDETWAILHTYAAHYGVTSITCGVVAEPPGQLTNGAHAVGRSYPSYMREMYRDMGGERVDPTVPYTVTQTRGLLVDNQRLLRAVGNALPRSALLFGEALLDNEMRFTFHKPARDDLTGAPTATCYTIDPRAVDDLQRRSRRVRDTLCAMSHAFWDTVQDKRMLRSVPGLTARQIEALTLAARGFSVAEMAEHMGVSLRSAEKMLAAARDKLGARTTAAAVYRAMVYRTLG